MKDRVILDEAHVPRFAPHIKLHFNEPRQQWVILGPERLLQPDETAVVILRQLDGKKALGEIIDALATKYDVERARIATDVLALVQGLVDKGFILHE